MRCIHVSYILKREMGTEVCPQNQIVLKIKRDSPKCQSELGPGTEYGRLEVLLPPQRRAELRGSTLLITDRTLSLVTTTSIALKWPIIMVSPQYGLS